MAHLMLKVFLLLTSVIIVGPVAPQEPNSYIFLEHDGGFLRVAEAEDVDVEQEFAVWTQPVRNDGNVRLTLRAGGWTLIRAKAGAFGIAPGLDCDVLPNPSGTRRTLPMHPENCTEPATFKQTGSCQPCSQNGIPARCCYGCMCCPTDSGESCGYCGWWSFPLSPVPPAEPPQPSVPVSQNTRLQEAELPGPAE